MERSIFFRLLQFAETYPQGVVPGRLTWTHYRALIAVGDDKRRLELGQKAIRQQWPARRLRHEIEKSRDAQAPAGRKAPGLLAEPPRHHLLTRRIKRYEEMGKPGVLRVDLGFEIQRELGAGEAKLGEGSLVQWNALRRQWEKKGAPETLYYYEARVIRVVDGDTLLVTIDLGFQMYRRQYLRLRGLNAAEAGSKEGARATAFLKRCLRKFPGILLRTHLTDRYDRFLADVWAGETYLNNALLQKGLAVKV